MPEVNGIVSELCVPGSLWEYVCASEFTRVAGYNVHLSQHWIYDILLDGKDSNHQSAPKAPTSLKGVTQGILLSPVGVYLYVWLRVWWRLVECFLCTCRQSSVATPAPIPNDTDTHTHTLTAVNSGDRRKMSYPPQPALLGSITLLHAHESHWGTTKTALSRPLQRCLLLFCGISVWV